MDIKYINEITVFADKLKPFKFNTVDLIDDKLIAVKLTDVGSVKVIAPRDSWVDDKRWLIQQTNNTVVTEHCFHEHNAIAELHLLFGNYKEYYAKQQNKKFNERIIELINRSNVTDLNLTITLEDNSVKSYMLKQIVQLKRELVQLIDNEDNN